MTDEIDKAAQDLWCAANEHSLVVGGVYVAGENDVDESGIPPAPGDALSIIRAVADYLRAIV